MTLRSPYDWIFLQSVIITGISILVNCIGIAVAVIFWRRSPKAAAICLLAMVFMLLVAIAQPVAITLLTRSDDPETMIFSMGFVRIIMGTVNAGAIGMLILAVFTDRRQNRST
jgi:hypothetical protein